MTLPRGTSGHPAVMAGRSAPLGGAGTPLLNSAMRPSGHTAVMAQRARVDPDDLDFFPTPPWAARAGGVLIKTLDPLAVTCWEPACGGGHMALPLSEYFDDVSISDIHDHGGPLSPLRLVGDFPRPGLRDGQ